jgi:hypothetical protein
MSPIRGQNPGAPDRCRSRCRRPRSRRHSRSVPGKRCSSIHSVRSRTDRLRNPPRFPGYPGEVPECYRSMWSTRFQYSPRRRFLPRTGSVRAGTLHRRGARRLLHLDRPQEPAATEARRLLPKDSPSAETVSAGLEIWAVRRNPRPPICIRPLPAGPAATGILLTAWARDRARGSPRRPTGPEVEVPGAVSR